MPSYKLTDLRKALMAYKKQKKFKGSPSKMKKGDIMEALKSLNFDFTSLSSPTKSSTEYDKSSGTYKKKEASSAPPSTSSKRGRKPKVNVPPSATKSPLVYDKATGTYVKQVPNASSSSVPPKKDRKSSFTAPPPRSSVPAGAAGSVPAGRPRGRPRKTSVPPSSMELVPVLNMKPATDTQYGRRYKSRVPLLGL